MTKAETMKKFSLHNTCPKCGFGALMREWHGHIASQYVVGNVEVPEHIERRCPRCGYVWREACLDNEEI